MPAKKSAEAGNNPVDQFLDNPSIVHALAYIPYFVWAALMFFFWKTEKKEVMHHIKYSLFLAVATIVLTILLDGFFDKVLVLGYLAVSGYFAYKAYNGEKIEVEVFDMIENKITEKISKK